MGKITLVSAPNGFVWECCVSRTPAGEPLAAHRIATGYARTLLDAAYAAMASPLAFEDGRPAKGARRRVWEVLPTGQRNLVWHDEIPLDGLF